jgi:hypothetical protein
VGKFKGMRIGIVGKKVIEGQVERGLVGTAGQSRVQEKMNDAGIRGRRRKREQEEKEEGGYPSRAW